MTQPGSFNTARPVTTSGSWFSRPGLLGGLAAGFLGAGLFGLLFGQGVFGGLGGLSSLLGLLVQVGLIAMVASLIWRWFQRRNEPATAAGPSLRDVGSAEPSDYRSGTTGVGRSSSAPALPSDEVGIIGADYDAFEKLLGDTQTAYSNEDLAALRSLATPEMVSCFASDLANNSSHGVINRICDVKLLQGDSRRSLARGRRRLRHDCDALQSYRPDDRPFLRPHSRGRSAGGHRSVDFPARRGRPLGFGGHFMVPAR